MCSDSDPGPSLFGVFSRQNHLLHPSNKADSIVMSPMDKSSGWLRVLIMYDLTCISFMRVYR